MNRKLIKYANILVLVIAFSVLNISTMYAVPEYPGGKGLYYSGKYYKKTAGNKYYISLNKYSAEENGYSEGSLHIYKNSKRKPIFSGYIWMTGKNKYKCTSGYYYKKKGKTYFTFTVKRNTIVVKQKRTVINKLSINGIYRIKERFYS